MGSNHRLVCLCGLNNYLSDLVRCYIPLQKLQSIFLLFSTLLLSYASKGDNAYSPIYKIRELPSIQALSTYPHLHPCVVQAVRHTWRLKHGWFRLSKIEKKR